ncbi:hypothetical protein BKA67DRAFT_583241 [Truncatella angustata]|uniref:Uncharacterized protein n=1 Tax=Truncatella angustata TaxID=152316 RepID=A0A9P8RHG8_9PEZI|nr:uncharacterized protein BKA67DRAFT_583241 [Truncatella angustata]KAH6646103.1 hypothetical protein BKA67DRAFT_583241 [Truncatella angustata]
MPSVICTTGNEWPEDLKWKTVGAFVARNLLIGLDGISRKMLQGVGMRQYENARFLAQSSVLLPLAVFIGAPSINLLQSHERLS